ncbi:hypothetical protein QN382_23315 [Pseudomonas sp. 10B1]|uniref:hypothetical protein n=1 Tax=unclassified Pseudomonas TaxID=196821 RepID=UPI002B23631E|nr:MULTISPECIES: hypothetical protein [unclassified Pseudomonas]MEA9997056.1 hypothetical protein [Pseudomonas sp. AA4]MEB0089246.1 hypothetical protein [Pseudomonas sp. RTI1]MEB0128438.1 hypothetical protein [Pseudomonas sp. CCC1.2]MEB0155336.1 hypothetical protein [Pseudomonas sp. CCC4.3]MEB0221704.1 hypothetical protein [Pseudomonas sp. AB12(2023)]
MAAPQAVKVETVDAVVAHGRTVIDVTGKRVGPGETAKVPSDEVQRLRELGFLSDGEVQEERREGPHISVSDGPTVRLA